MAGFWFLQAFHELRRGNDAAGSSHFLHLVVESLILHTKAEKRGALEVLDWELLSQSVPVPGGSFRAAVVVAKDHAAGLHDFEGLRGLGSQAIRLVTRIAEDDGSGSVVRRGIPCVQTFKDLLDFCLQRLIPIEEADVVLTWNRRIVQGDHLSVGGKVQSNIQSGAAFGSAKFDYALGFQEVHNMGKNH